MGAEKRTNYVMSVELAMQREMSYRQKLQSMKLKSSELSQVPSQTSVQAPRAILRPSPNPCPRPTFGFLPNPRPQAMSGPNPNPCLSPTLGLNPNQRPLPHFGPRPGQAPSPRPNTWHHGPTAGPIPLARPPHSISGPTHSADHKRKEPLPMLRDFYCYLCEMDCTSAKNLRMHLKGHKHKAKLKESKGKIPIPAAGGTLAKEQQFHCGLFGIWCTDEFALRQHFNGKNHILKLHASQINMKGPDGGSVVPQI